MMKAIKFHRYILIFALFVVAGSAALNGQKVQEISGVLKDQAGKQPVAYATVSIYDANDSAFITGTLSDPQGEFHLKTDFTGKAFLKISFVGYKPFLMDIEVTANEKLDAGTISLEEESYLIGEAVITGNRIKAHDEADKTTYLVNKKIYGVSNTGLDVLKHIPGVQVDLMQNVYLEGSPDILILVNGIERDRNFIQQLGSDMIDKVEIMPIPSSRYDADISGVINVILKKDKKAGVNGQLSTDIPVRRSEIYSFPMYSVNLSHKNFNVFTSCNGDMHYFDMHEGYERKLSNHEEITEIEKSNSFRQKDWSFRFHYGFDYFINEKNLVNFYTYRNPARYGDAGDMRLRTWNPDDLTGDWNAFKNDVDKTDMSYYSLYYKHQFKKPGQAISCDMNYFHYQSDRILSYEWITLSGYQLPDNITETRPVQSTMRVKIDYTTTLGDHVKLDAGMKTEYSLRKNQLLPELLHQEEICALYTSLQYDVSRWNLNGGLRAEKSVARPGENDPDKNIALLPHSVVSFSINSKQQLKLSYRRQIRHPVINHLDSYRYTEDPFTVFCGNPGLDPEMQDRLYLDYSIRFGNQYLSHRLFYAHISDAIQRLSYMNGQVMETEVHNLGDLDYYGYQLTGSISPHRTITVNTNMKLFVVQTFPGRLASSRGIEEKTQAGFELGLSAIAAFKHDINLSLLLNYNSAVYDIQHRTTKAPLYFIQLDKSFKKKLKIGIMACLPFTKTFNDSRVLTASAGMQNLTGRDIRLSTFPLMLNIGYRFSSGKVAKQIERDKDLIEPVEREGL